MHLSPLSFGHNFSMVRKEILSWKDHCCQAVNITYLSPVPLACGMQTTSGHRATPEEVERCNCEKTDFCL